MNCPLRLAGKMLVALAGGRPFATTTAQRYAFASVSWYMTAGLTFFYDCAVERANKGQYLWQFLTLDMKRET
jgi:hypothetical protein